MQGRLFEPFTPADGSSSRTFGGLGLGLAISHRLVKQTGGELQFESEPDRGSVFHFTIRLKKEGTRNIGDTPGLDSLLSRTRAIILDSSAGSRRVLSEYLSSWGIENFAASSPAAAMDELRNASRGARPFHLGLVHTDDSNSPGANLIREIKLDPALAPLKVLATTSFETRDDEAAHEGADATICKPVGPSSLFNCIARLLQDPEEPATPGDIQPERQPFASRGSVSVLVVEDNLVKRSLAKAQLESLGYLADVAPDGSSALDLLAQKNCDILLMYCDMPGKDGIRPRPRSAPATAAVDHNRDDGACDAGCARTMHRGGNGRLPCQASEVGATGRDARQMGA